MIVRDPNDPHEDLYDVDDFVIFLADWMHYLSLERYPGLIRRQRLVGQTPDNILINGLGNYTVRHEILM